MNDLVPNTARLIALMLAGQGVEDADERVLHQLMDFTHRESAFLNYKVDLRVHD
jgi:hypothetical protein